MLYFMQDLVIIHFFLLALYFLGGPLSLVTKTRTQNIAVQSGKIIRLEIYLTRVLHSDFLILQGVYFKIFLFYRGFTFRFS